MRWLVGLALVSLLTVAGCSGGDGRVPVSGTVTLNDQALPGAALSFTPTGETHGQNAIAATGPDGKYSVMGPQGQKGLHPGTYKVTVSRLLRKDGTPPRPDLPPIESDGVESLPPHYSDPEKTTLTITVEGKKDYNLSLKLEKKQ